MTDGDARPATAATDVYELVLEEREGGKKAFAWVKTLAVAIVTMGAGAPQLDVVRARIVRRADGEVVREVDNRFMPDTTDLVAEVTHDIEALDVEAFEAKWL